MALGPGARFGPYEIVAPLGAGGMGEVYRAHDTKLGRDVALKVLPDPFVDDAERRARFEREAKTLAVLNHPHIAQIYGYEEGPTHEGGHHGALVMELVEGSTLSQRIARGAVPLDQALPIARQIADALEYAHEHGVVHRDLKPANIKLTPEGAVKVLDFGLAKAIDQASSLKPQALAEATQSPTITSPAMTKVGVILGTAAYMSPEQARGATVDKRTDIWAFGCVLYELLTGRHCFTGQSVTDVLAAIVRAEPDWTALPPETPSRVRNLLGRCLRKDAKQRLHDIADARLEIEEAIARGSVDTQVDEATSRPARSIGVARREKLAWALLAAALTALGAAGLMLSGVWQGPRPSATRSLRVSIVHTEGSEVGTPAISPDGRRVAYAARRLDGMPVLWVRDLASGELRALTGTEGASLPFWSPDSRHLGFGAGSVLKRVPADGGPVQVVIQRPAYRGGTWGHDGTIVFSEWDGTPMLRVNSAGGTATPVTTLQGQDWSHYWPSFLPDGRRFLFTARQWTRPAETGENGIYLGSLDSPEIRRLLPDLSSAVYAAPDALVFVREGMLTAAPFDVDAGRLSGSPTTIGGAVAVDDVLSLSGISASVEGQLAVRPPPAFAMVGNNGPAAFEAELHLLDRTGAVSLVVPAHRFSDYMALHPDGRRVALAITDPRASTQDLWLIDLQSGAKTPLTTARGFTFRPIWSPDGTRVVYARQPPGQMDDVYLQDLRTGQVTPVIESPANEDPLAWSHDGSHLLVYTTDGKGKRTLSTWSFESRTLTELIGSTVWDAVFAPDDRHVALTSLESGRPEVIVTTFPERHQTWSLTTEGGQVLSWRADGREILVATLSGHIVAYPVSTEGGFSAGQPTVLVRDVGIAAPFSTATRDHSKILIRVSPDAAKDKGEIRLLFGWADPWRQGKTLIRP